MKKNFTIDYDNKIMKKDKDSKDLNETLKTWNKEVPEHVKKFNSYIEDRNAIIYFSLFVESHITKTVKIFLPEFETYFSNNENLSIKIKIIGALEIIPKQIIDACLCIRNIRNEFAHEISIIDIDDLKELPSKRKTSTYTKLMKLTNDYKGDYDYFDYDDTIKNRFKSICMNVITAFRIYEPFLLRLAKKIRE